VPTTPRQPAAGWLFKEEPDHYSLADLERDGTTLWDGVSNALARQNLRKVRRGDRILFYHTGKEKAVVGEMRAVSGPQPDPASDDSAAVVVRVGQVRRWPAPISLTEIKKVPELAGWDLVRLPRLSVLPVTAEQWQRLEAMGRQEARPPAP
jgi:predicted RNA-binding protein with PUA-like domain